MPILGTVIVALTAIIGFFIREWRTDRKIIGQLHEKVGKLENEIKAFHNGSSAAVVVDRVSTLWKLMVEQKEK
jgi:hypothetical protein